MPQLLNVTNSLFGIYPRVLRICSIKRGLQASESLFLIYAPTGCFLTGACKTAYLIQSPGKQDKWGSKLFCRGPARNASQREAGGPAVNHIKGIKQKKRSRCLSRMPLIIELLRFYPYLLSYYVNWLNDRVITNQPLNYSTGPDMERDEILFYLKTSNQDKELFLRADEVRKKHCGDKVHIRGIIEFSNHCCRDCLYCGLRRKNRHLNRYRMDEDEIVGLATHIASCGVKTIVLQSGDDFYYSQSMLCRIIARIKESADVAVTLSVGERPFEDYKAFRLAGADRYLLKHETANEELYTKLHPNQSLKNRLNILEYLKETGYQIGAGNIVGLPGQGMKDLCEDILLVKSLDADMASAGLFIPQKETPLSKHPRGSLPLSLKVIALVRILTKNSHMPVTTAIATADPENGLLMGLKAGANVIMPDFTPPEYRKDYTIYDNKAHITLERTKEVIRQANRCVASNKGNSLKKP